MAPKNLAAWGLSLLALVLLGTIAVLSTVKSFFGVDWNDQITVHEIEYLNSTQTASVLLPYDAKAAARKETYKVIDGKKYEYERIPRILHQTWKSDDIPERWASFSAQCRDMHPDYQYMLWTDASAKSFIAEHYSWFLPTYEGYPHNIQRADAIRYFVLHKYGGVYLDLDIGCRRPVDPLLNYPAILPATKPVGVSNDLMFSEPKSPFMDTVIHNLMAFDHQYLSAYPTVMFSTGPMFLSAMLSLWNSKESQSSEIEAVRILPKQLYGKNALPQDVPDSFFWHYYGSSWHENDSGFIVFLGTFGKTIMQIMAFVLVIGAIKLLWNMRFAIFGKLLGGKDGKGAIRLPYHVNRDGSAAVPTADGYSSDSSAGTGGFGIGRARSPFYHHHSRNASIQSSNSRPASPAPYRHKRSSSDFSTAPGYLDQSQHRPITPTPLSINTAFNAKNWVNPALGQRGALFFLPLWYPTSTPATPSPSSSLPFHLDSQQQSVPPPAYRPHSPNHSQSATANSQVPDWNPNNASSDAHHQAVSAFGLATYPYGPFASSSHNYQHGANGQGSTSTGVYNRAANVPANPASDADALSLHEFVQSQKESKESKTSSSNTASK